MNSGGQIYARVVNKKIYMAILAAMIYFMYSPSFLSDYLMNDERGFVRDTVKNEMGDFISAIVSAYLIYGRGLFGLYQKIVYDFVGYDTSRIQFVRFLNFLSLLVIALLLFDFLEKRVKRQGFAFLAILFLYSQTCFQVLMGYSLQLISNSQPSMWLSLLAFYLHFYAFRKSRTPGALQYVITFLVLILAMQSTQTYAFFSLILVSYLALTEWDEHKGRINSFIFMLVLVMFVSILTFKYGVNLLSGVGGSAYVLGETALEQLDNNPVSVVLIAINPRTYWSVFKIWSFPYFLHNTPPLSNLLEKSASFFVMTVWALILVWAFIVELVSKDGRVERGQIALKWLTVPVSLGLAAVFIISDSPMEIIDHRPHVLLTFVGLSIFTGLYAFEVISGKHNFLQGWKVDYIAWGFVFIIALGVQSGFLRNIVITHVEQMEFVRSELMRKDPQIYNTVAVVMPKWNGCLTEPCGPWIGWQMDEVYHLGRTPAYWYALHTLGIPPESKNIIFLKNLPDTIPSNTVIVNWNVYASAQQRHADYFRRNTGFAGWPGLFEK